MTAMLSVKDVSCVREDRTLFQSLSFDVNTGDIIQIEGPNGAGKSTLLRILTGLFPATEGEVWFKGASIIEDREQYLSEMLFIGHHAGVKGEMTAEENLAFYLSLHGYDLTPRTSDVDSTTDEALEQVGLYGFEDAFASSLSAGQHRRTALARLLPAISLASKKPEETEQPQKCLWILDEPFTAIDKKGVANLERWMTMHTEAGGAIVLTTHQDLGIACKRVKLDYQVD